MAPFHLVLATLDANIFHKINLRNSKFPPIVFKIYLLLIYQNFSLNYNINDRNMSKKLDLCKKIIYNIYIVRTLLKRIIIQGVIK